MQGKGLGRRGLCHLNAHPTPVAWPYLKVIFSVDMFFRCFIMCILFSPSGESF